MRKKTLLPPLIALTAVLIASCGDTPEPGPLASLAPLDPAQGQLPEGIAADDNALYIGMAPTSQVYRMTLDGQMTLFAQLPAAPEGQSLMLGMALDQQGNLFVALTSFVPEVQTGIYRVPGGGGDPILFASHEAMTFPNGTAFDEDGNLFVGDSSGVVLKVTPSGAATVWLDHSLIKGDQDACPPAVLPFEVGPNGVAFNDQGDLFILNTDKGTIVRAAMRDDGSPGTPEVYAGPDCDNLKGADGLAFDEDDNLYVTSFILNKLVKVDKDKKVTVLDSAGLLDSPANLTFGKGDQEKTLYIANFALLSAQGGGSPRPAILSKEIGIKGLEVP